MLPNIITSIRILFVPLFIYVYFMDSPNRLYYAIGVLVLSALTDILDGYLARKLNMITRIGQVLDPLVDKAVQLTVAVCLTIDDIIPRWVFGIIIAKELSMVIGGSFLFKRKVTVSASWYGKLATVVFYVAVVVMIFTSEYRNAVLNIVLTTIILLSTLFALVMYFWNFKDDLREQVRQRE